MTNLSNRTWLTAGAWLAVVLLFRAQTVSAQVDNFRIFEVDPDAGQAEIVNTGPDHLTNNNHPFCHRFRYTDIIPTATGLTAGEFLIFDFNNLDAFDSDLWLYRSSPFQTGSNIVHGLKYGSSENVGRTALASSVGLWDGGTSHAPAPPFGTTLAWDGFGNSRADWYIDETPTMGGPDVPAFQGFDSDLTAPMSTEDFEEVLLGEPIDAIEDWSIIETGAFPGAFTGRIVTDVLGDIVPREDSNRWLRVHDGDDTVAQNRIYSPTIDSGGAEDYTWSFYLNLEDVPEAGSANGPLILVQHAVGNGFSDTWGLEIDNDSIALIVTGVGGEEASVELLAFDILADRGTWVLVTIAVDFDGLEVSATADGGDPVSLPISPDAEADRFRLCYNGDGIGNIATILLDDISIDVAEVGGGETICGDADGSGTITATDALIALNAAVGSAECDPSLCDVSGNDGVLASDALIILNAAVGQPVELSCPQPA